MALFGQRQDVALVRWDAAVQGVEVNLFHRGLSAALRHRDAAVEGAVIDAVECAVLVPCVGQNFEAIVVDRNKQGVVVQLGSPAVVASVHADVALGESISVTLVGVDPVAPDRRSPEYLATFVEAEIAKWAGPVKASGLAAE